MRFAVATAEGGHVAEHTGRCRGFAIFDATDDGLVRVEFRPNTFTAHALGRCTGPEASEEHGSHAELVDALGDCTALVTRGLGPRLLADLNARGIRTYVCDCQDVDEAALQLAQGRLAKASGCAHHCH